MNLHAGRWGEMDVGGGWQWDAIRGRRGGQCGRPHRGGWAGWDRGLGLGPGAVGLGEVRAGTSGGFKGRAG